MFNLEPVIVNTGIEPSKAEQIGLVFKPMEKLLLELEKEHTELIEQIGEEGITDELLKDVRKLRLKYVKVRTSTENQRKHQKKRVLVEGKAIDGIASILFDGIYDQENQLKEIENHKENQEKERKAKLAQERADILFEYEVGNTNAFNLGEMSEEVWNNFLFGTREGYKQRKLAEEQAEKERIEKEKKEKVYLERLFILREFKQFCKGIPITQETTEKEYKKILKDLKAKAKEYKKKQKEIKAENKRLKEKQEEQDRKTLTAEIKLQIERANFGYILDNIEKAIKFNNLDYKFFEKAIEDKRIELMKKEEENKKKEKEIIRIANEEKEKEKERIKREKAEKDGKLQKFLDDNNFDDETMELKQKGDTFYIWKIIAKTTIN